MKKFLVLDENDELRLMYVSNGQPDPAEYVQEVSLEVDSLDDLTQSGETYNFDINKKNLRLQNEKMEFIRQVRDRLLKESDFSQLADAPFDSITKQAWRDYRQELRDLPDSILDVYNFQWPVKPS